MTVDPQKDLRGEAVARQILTAESQIERANSKLLRLEDILDDVSQAIKALGFEFASISLVFPEHNTIEAIRGFGQADGWTNRARHYLEQDPNLRDIQADIVQTCRTEIISGWDRRFDRWIYKTFNHERLVRAFTPILLVLDETGELRTDWVNYCNWEEITYENYQEDNCGRCTSRTMHLSDLPSQRVAAQVRVIGTVEAGYELSESGLSAQQIHRYLVENIDSLITCVAQQSPKIWRAQLPYVLEVIAKRAKRILRADSTTLYFLRKPNQSDPEHQLYIHQVAAGEMGRRFLETCPPRTRGLGQQAIRSGKCEYIDNAAELASFNPRTFEAGIRAIAAFPLQVDSREFPSSVNDLEGILKEGVLYVVYRQEHSFTEEQLRWGALFARRAVDAIRHAMFFQQAHNRERQMVALQSITQSLIRVGEGEPLHHIAWNTLNILGADVVTIYEYIHSEQQFLTPPEIAGWVKDSQRMDTKIGKENVPFKLIHHGSHIYAPHQAGPAIFQNSPFAQREGIQSAAGIILQVDEKNVGEEQNKVGVMFINYRRFHSFPDEEKQLIEMLAASAAIAIKNQRRLYTFDDINLEELAVAPNQEELLSLVMQKAIKITNAHFGTIRLLAPNQPVLITKARYPEDLEINSSRSRTRIGEGITGWVARTRQSELVNDVGTDQRYQAYFASTEVGSELCVPLVNKNDLLGVLNVESQRKDAFDRRHLWMLKNLAYYAVIAIQNVQNKERLVRLRTIATFNNLAGQLVHLTNNNVGALRTLALRIIRANDARSKENAQEILLLAEEILEKANAMGRWIREQGQLQPIDLCQAIETALKQVPIPRNVISVCSLPEDLPQVLGGEQQITHVFVNLVQNAVDAMPRGGALKIRSECYQQGNGQQICVYVQDTGNGIAEENLERIFQHGYSTRKKGMGFGLWWTKGYIEELEGHLSVKSRTGEGTTFTVVLPAYAQVH